MCLIHRSCPSPPSLDLETTAWLWRGCHVCDKASGECKSRQTQSMTHFEPKRAVWTLPSTASSIVDLALFSDNRLGVFVKSGKFSTTFELTTPLEFAAQTHHNGAGACR